jgi:hypothetical protein
VDCISKHLREPSMQGVDVARRVLALQLHQPAFDLGRAERVQSPRAERRDDLGDMHLGHAHGGRFPGAVADKPPLAPVLDGDLGGPRRNL